MLLSTKVKTVGFKNVKEVCDLLKKSHQQLGHTYAYNKSQFDLLMTKAKRLQKLNKDAERS